MICYTNKPTFCLGSVQINSRYIMSSSNSGNIRILLDLSNAYILSYSTACKYLLTSNGIIDMI